MYSDKNSETHDETLVRGIKDAETEDIFATFLNVLDVITRLQISARDLCSSMKYEQPELVASIERDIEALLEMDDPRDIVAGVKVLRDDIRSICKRLDSIQKPSKVVESVVYRLDNLLLGAISIM